MSIPDLLDWSERTATFQEFAGFTIGTASLTGLDAAQRVVSVRVTQNLLDVWGIRPALGRNSRPEEMRVGAERVVMLSHAFWERQFSKTATVLGQTLVLDGATQLMTESTVSSSVAGAIGLLLASLGLVAIRMIGSDMEGFSELALNGRVIAADVALSFLAPFGCALLPAMRMATPDMDELRHGNRGAESVRGRRVREILVALQAGFALILMMQVGFIVRTTWKLHNLEKGFDPAQVLTLRLDLAADRYPEAGAVRDFFSQAIGRIQALPGVAAAGATTRLPIADRELSVRFAIEGAPSTPPESQPVAARSGISADYLKTMRIPLMRGRALARTDFGNAPPVALVSEAAAGSYWPNQNPVGQRITFDVSTNREWLEVIGIVRNVRNSNAGSDPVPQIYVPNAWQPERSMVMVVRTVATDPTQLAPVIRSELARVDKDQPVYGIASMERVLFDDLGPTYLLSGMLAVIGAVALLLAAAGVYGVVSYSVSQRTREIGLRMALGARPSEVLTMILARGNVPVVVGLVLGAAGSAGLAHLTSTAMEDIDFRDPVGYLVVLVPLVGLALLASYIPARRATRVDPMLALREE